MPPLRVFRHPGDWYRRNVPAVRPQPMTVAVAFAIVIALGLHIFMLVGLGQHYTAGKPLGHRVVTAAL